MNDENSIIYVSQTKSVLENNPKNGTPLIESEFGEENIADLHSDDSLRSWKTGILDLNILRENVYSKNLIFLDIDYVKLKEILNALKNKSDGGFYASVFNYEKGQREVLHMYRSDRAINKRKYLQGYRFDLSVSIIQL